MGKFALLLFSILTAQTLWSQSIRVSGSITDPQGQPIDMATILLKDSAETLLTGGVCDMVGTYSFEVNPPQDFVLQISCIGYTSRSYPLKNEGRDITLSTALQPSATDLGEVVVSSKVPLVRREIDRLVLNAEKLNATATNGLDVLRHTPGLVVQEDEISMLNKGKIIVLMNGRELKMDMKGLMTYLGSLSADNLKQIEVMTTPPAKYFAEGNAGVINIVTKKMKNNFLGGNVSNRFSLQEQTYDDASLSLQYKKNRLEAYANMGFGLGTMQYDNQRHIDYQTETWHTTTSREKSNDYLLGLAGIDLSLTPESSLGAILSYSRMSPDADTEAKTIVQQNQSKLKQFETLTHTQVHYDRYNANLHYSHYGIGQEGTFEVNADYLYYTIDDHIDLQTEHDESLSYLSLPQVEINIYQCTADLELPMGNATWSCGAAYSQSETDNCTIYERLSTDYDLDDHFVYNEDILAAYVDLQYRFSDKWETKLGVRGEYGRLEGTSIKLNTSHVNHQFDLFPTAFIDYHLSEEQTLSLSMTSRINRPSYVDINPFTTYSDAHTVQTGNPALQPEKSYSAELGYTVGDFSLSTSFMQRNRCIASYTTIDPDKRLTIKTVDNVMQKQMYSLDFSYYFDRCSWFNTSIDGSLYTVAAQAESGYDMESTTHTALFLYINNNLFFNRKKTLLANLWGQYQSKQKDVVGESLARYRIDFGLKCLLFDKKLTLGLDAQNLLASHTKSVVRTADATYTYDAEPFRVWKLTLSYKFGKRLNVKPKSFGIDTNRL